MPSNNKDKLTSFQERIARIFQIILFFFGSSPVLQARVPPEKYFAWR
jgi:hypothetical protein